MKWNFLAALFLSLAQTCTSGASPREEACTNALLTVGIQIGESRADVFKLDEHFRFRGFTKEGLSWLNGLGQVLRVNSKLNQQLNSLNLSHLAMLSRLAKRNVYIYYEAAGAEAGLETTRQLLNLLYNGPPGVTLRVHMTNRTPIELFKEDDQEALKKFQVMYAKYPFKLIILAERSDLELSGLESLPWDGLAALSRTLFYVKPELRAATLELAGDYVRRNLEHSRNGVLNNHYFPSFSLIPLGSQNPDETQELTRGSEEILEVIKFSALLHLLQSPEGYRLLDVTRPIALDALSAWRAASILTVIWPGNTTLNLSRSAPYVDFGEKPIVVSGPLANWNYYNEIAGEHERFNQSFADVLSRRGVTVDSLEAQLIGADPNQ